MEFHLMIKWTKLYLFRFLCHSFRVKMGDVICDFNTIKFTDPLDQNSGTKGNKILFETCNYF